MKVVCVTTALSEDTLLTVGGSARWEMDKSRYLTVGKEYLVYGLEVLVDREGYDSGVHVLIVPDIGYLVSFRLLYFAISDPSVSKYWQVQQDGSTRTTLFPPSFYREGYLDTYCRQNEYDKDDIREILDDFEEVSRLLDTEASSK